MEGIDGAALLTDIFGSWPSFHDSEVVRIELLRGDPTESGPVLVADVHLFEMTPEVSPSGHLVLRKHTLATMCFWGLQELELDGFNAQNALMGLAITDIRPEQLEGGCFRVSFDASYGVSASFVCRAIQVTDARPWGPERRDLAV